MQFEHMAKGFVARSLQCEHRQAGEKEVDDDP